MGPIYWHEHQRSYLLKWLIHCTKRGNPNRKSVSRRWRRDYKREEQADSKGWQWALREFFYVGLSVGSKFFLSKYFWIIILEFPFHIPFFSTLSIVFHTFPWHFRSWLWKVDAIYFSLCNCHWNLVEAISSLLFQTSLNLFHLDYYY